MWRVLSKGIERHNFRINTWTKVRLKSLINKIENGKWGTEAKGDQNDIPVVRIADFDRRNNVVENQKFVVRNINLDTQSLIDRKRDILIEKSGGGDKTPVGQAVIFDSNQMATFTNFITKLSVNIELVSLKYLNYVLSYMYQSGMVRRHIKQTTGIQNLDITSYLNEKIFIPSKDVQHKIVVELDYISSKIRNIISETQQSIEELKKYKQSLITEAVTKGLDPNVEMKDSGIEWIGEIPSDWIIKKTRYFLMETSIKNHPDEEVLSLYRDYGVVPKNSRDDNHNVTSANTSNYKFVRKNDVVINKMKAWQGSIAISEYKGIVSPAYYTFEVTDKEIEFKFLHYALRNNLYLDEYMRLSAGLRVGQWDLNKNEFKNILYPFPNSISEQLQIVSYLDEQTSRIDKLIEDKTKVIEELEDYKKSLIYEYVTGKKEV